MVKFGYKLDLSIYTVDQLGQLLNLKVITTRDVEQELGERGLEPKDVLLAIRKIIGKGET